MDKRRLKLLGCVIVTVVTSNILVIVKGSVRKHPLGVFSLEFCCIAGACLGAYLFGHFLPRE
jgi:hypothetical protein